MAKPSKETPRNATQSDVRIGLRIKAARADAGVSQQELAKRLGVTFQQVQKYERGFNRITASRLGDLADILGKPVEWFFGLEHGASRNHNDQDGVLSGASLGTPSGTFPSPASGASPGASSGGWSLLDTPEGAKLARVFIRLKSPDLRRRAVALVAAIADLAEAGDVVMEEGDRDIGAGAGGSAGDSAAAKVRKGPQKPARAIAEAPTPTRRRSESGAGNEATSPRVRRAKAPD